QEAGKFMPINQQTVDGMEKHVNRASQSLRDLYADITKLRDGDGQNNLYKEYEALEKRIGHGTLTQDAVKQLKTRIKEEQVLQQVIDRQNKEYIDQERLVQKINKLRATAWANSNKNADDVALRGQLTGMISSVRGDPSPENLARQALE